MRYLVDWGTFISYPLHEESIHSTRAQNMIRVGIHDSYFTARVGSEKLYTGSQYFGKDRIQSKRKLSKAKQKALTRTKYKAAHNLSIEQQPLQTTVMQECKLTEQPPRESLSIFRGPLRNRVPFCPLQHRDLSHKEMLETILLSNCRV